MDGVKKVYYRLLVFILIYIEFGYHMVVTSALPGNVRTLIIILITIPLLFSKRTSFSETAFVLFSYLGLVILLNMARDNAIGDLILLFVPLFIGFVVANRIDLRNAIDAFNDVIFFLACFSLITYSIALIFPSIIEKLPLLGQVYDSKATMHNAVFSVCISNASFIRNYGITWEPGAFSVLLCISLFTFVVVVRPIKIYKVIILLAAIITTFSTMGYFVAAGILALLLFREKYNKSRWKVFVLFIVGVLGLFFILPDSARNVVFSKLEGLFGGGDIAVTTQARINAIIYPFKAFLQSPFFGVGYEQFKIVNVTLCDGVATNTIINWFAVMGICFAIPCVVGYFKCIDTLLKWNKFSGVGRIMGIFLSILLVSTESLLRISLIYIVIFYGININYSRKGVANIEEQKYRIGSLVGGRNI